MHPKDITPRNNKGKLHGYCEFYYDDGKLIWKGVCVNEKRYGYNTYSFDGVIDKYGTGYWSNDTRISSDNKEGYCYVWNKNDV